MNYHQCYDRPRVFSANAEHSSSPSRYKLPGLWEYVKRDLVADFERRA